LQSEILNTTPKIKCRFLIPNWKSDVLKFLNATYRNGEVFNPVAQKPKLDAKEGNV